MYTKEDILTQKMDFFTSYPGGDGAGGAILRGRARGLGDRDLYLSLSLESLLGTWLYILGKCGAKPRRIFLDFGQAVRRDLGRS